MRERERGGAQRILPEMRPVPPRVRERHLNEKKREIEKIRKKERDW